MSSFYTPLRYPGGKRKLFHFFENLLTLNNLDGCSYAEPYAGGAGLAMKLLFKEKVSHIYINDLDPALYAFWSSVLNDCSRLCHLIKSTPVNMKHWKIQRQVQIDWKSASTLDLGFSTFYLNRTNRSGILKGGVIGGKHQDGKYSITARFNKKDLIKRIENIAAKRDRISLTRLDGIAFVKSLVSAKVPNLLIYLDPPYFVKGRALYSNFFSIEDHKNLARQMKKVNGSWVVSYDEVDEISKLYSWCRSLEYSIEYTAQNKTSGNEVMFFSKSLAVPETLVLAKSIA